MNRNLGISFEYANRQSSTFSIKRSTGPVAWHRGHGDGMTTNHVEVPVRVATSALSCSSKRTALMTSTPPRKERETHVFHRNQAAKLQLTGCAKSKRRKTAKSADRAHLERSDGVDNLMTFRGNKLGAQPITGAKRHLAQWTFEHYASQVRADDQNPLSKHRAPRRRCPSHQRGTLCQDSQKQKFPGNKTVRGTY